MIKILALFYLIVLGILIYTRVKDKPKIGLICKSILGILFITMSLILVYDKKFADLSGLLIIFALLCNAIGDIFLGLCKVDTENNNYYFYFAVIVIAMAQTAYLFVSVELTRFNLLSLPLALAAVLIMYIINNKKYKLSKQAIIGLLYSVVLTTATFNAALNISKSAGTKFFIFACGMILYWVSDIILFVVKFAKKSKALDVTNKILYYAAQLVIACCIAF